EYLAGGRPVVSTPVADVVRHYGTLKGVHIAEGADAFLAGCDAALAQRDDASWLDEADAALSHLSWDHTQARMAVMVDRAAALREPLTGGVAHRPCSTGPGSIRAPESPFIRPSNRASHYDALVVGAG